MKRSIKKKKKLKNLGRMVAPVYTLILTPNGSKRAGDGGHNMINMTVRELYCTFADMFQNINFAGRNSAAVMGGGGNIFLGPA
jgi:hypothetical protein